MLGSNRKTPQRLSVLKKWDKLVSMVIQASLVLLEWQAATIQALTAIPSKHMLHALTVSTPNQMKLLMNFVKNPFVQPPVALKNSPEIQATCRHVDSTGASTVKKYGAAGGKFMRCQTCMFRWKWINDVWEDYPDGNKPSSPSVPPSSQSLGQASSSSAGSAKPKVKPRIATARVTRARRGLLPEDSDMDQTEEGYQVVPEAEAA